jgi:hypothetical protein
MAPPRSPRDRVAATRERSIEPPYGDGRRLQLDDPITVGEPITHARPLFLVDPGRGSRGEASVPEPTST